MNKQCRQCSKPLPNNWSTDICLECSMDNVRKIFKEDPQLEQAFKETIEEMKKPENVKKMAEDACKFMKAVLEIQKAGNVNENN